VPAGLGVRTTRRPRPPAARGSLLPMRRTPRLLGVLPGPRTAPRRTGPGLAADRRSVGGIPPYARRPRYRATAASPSSPRRHRGGLAYKNQTPCPHPGATPSRRPPLPPSRRTCMLASIPGRLTILTYSLGPLEACVVAYLPGITRRRRSHLTPWPSPPATTVRCRRVPLCPNSEHPRALGELTLLPAPLHGRERYQPRRISAARAAGHGQGQHCKPPNLSRVF
jgi:hypothetical protein